MKNFIDPFCWIISGLIIAVCVVISPGVVIYKAIKERKKNQELLKKGDLK